MEDIFNLENTDPIPLHSLTHEEFVKNIQAFLEELLRIHAKNWKDVDNGEDAPECSRCHGFTEIEQGGESVTCPNCKGEGIETSERIFDTISFGSDFEELIFESKHDIFELLGWEKEHTQKWSCEKYHHKWKYNFASMPSKAICSECKIKNRFNLHDLEWFEVETFENETRTDDELIKQWI